MKRNKITVSIIIVFISFCTFCSGYTMGSSFVFADSTTDNWMQVTTNEQLVEAFKYYCKSRDLTIEGSIADGVTSFTTKTFNGICNKLGINVTALQAHLMYETDSNLGTRFLFDSVGISAYNQIFAQFLQDNELDIGDSADQANNTLYSGYYWEDDDGFGCLVTIASQTGLDTATVTYVGTPYIYTASNLISLVNSSYTLNSPFIRTVHYNNGSTYNYMFYYGSNGSIVGKGTAGINYPQTLILKNYAGVLYDGFPNIVFNTVSSYRSAGLYFGNLTGDGTNAWPYKTHIDLQIVNSQNSSACTIYLTTNNTVINNNNYEGDTIINNNGTTGDDNPDEPLDLPDPDYQPAEDWDIDLPDLSIPNWILSGKENKFPFDIPFNVMYALSLLQAEPEAPRLVGSLDFGFYEWEYDLDLSDFDSVAVICRNMEVLAFITGLMLMTRKLIWG